MKQMIATCVPSLGEVSVHWAVNYSLLTMPKNVSALRLFKLNLSVAEGRNALVQSAFEFEKRENIQLGHIFWIDDDVIVLSQALIHLLSRNVPIVSGVYFTKDDYSQPLMFPGEGEGVMDFVPDLFQPIWGHGMGLTLVNADVYRRMQKELDLGVDSLGTTAWYRTHNKSVVDEGNGKTSLLSMTEDFFFLENARKLGITTYIDTTRRAFGWHYNRNLQKGYPEKQFVEWQSKGTITWDTPSGPVVWQG